ncbi:SPOSA6832_02578 [Sporobolomyces salmonicolor]|uniref:SPOSA6832_02578-mRNA-1:cds n=1 Tax=Sporidiobolus salmonicolor TaxID=5005 RepID=A0A0D6EMR4_SPOSA|nr:SPOSA6832_02578 [Sporobolomyces salmonicolor]
MASSQFTSHSHSRSQSMSPSTSADAYAPATTSPRRAGAYQSHLRRGSAIPAHLMGEFTAAPSPTAGPAFGAAPSPFGSSAGGAGARGGHNRRGSVIDIAADMIGGQAGTEQLEKVRRVSDKVEDKIDQFTRPVRPWLPGIGRFLIVVTFLEDALRILTQLSGESLSHCAMTPARSADKVLNRTADQNYYLQRHRGFPWGVSHVFLYTNVIIMLICSSLIVAKRFPFYSTLGLLVVVISQGFGYGLIFDFTFFLRNLSVIGGLLMALSDALSAKKSSLVGVPSMGVNDQDRKKYFQLFGRVLLVLLFLGFVFNGQTGVAKGAVSVSGLVACLFVAVGYKAKQSALFLVVVLGAFNFTVNAWWRVHKAHPQRDFLKYDFFQTLSIVGGLLLLVNLGAGDFAIEQKKRM